MDSDFTVEQLQERASGKIELGEELIDELNAFSEIPGVQKIQRKIKQEVKFLQKVIKNGTLKLNHIQCTNLTHYEFLVRIMKLQRDVIHIDCGFTLKHRPNPLRVDIVCENGLKWIKAIARNPKSLADAAKGDASFGARSILDQAEEFVEATEQHLCMFKRPTAIFYFSQDIHSDLLDELRCIGVETATLSEAAEANDSIYENDISNVSVLNLDVTTMLAFVSAVCNGEANWVFQEGILTEQAERERQSPVKPILDQLFEGKRLICCETAYKSFQDIVGLLAGPSERVRAKELMERVELLPDVPEIPPELAVIKLSGKISRRSLDIFAFGMRMKALTVTSNKAFVRSASMQGINIPVFTHQARALTEGKQAFGTRL